MLGALVAPEGRHHVPEALPLEQSLNGQNGGQQLDADLGGAADGLELPEVDALGVPVIRVLLALVRADRKSAAVVAGEEHALDPEATSAHRERTGETPGAHQQRRVLVDELVHHYVAGRHQASAI